MCTCDVISPNSMISPQVLLLSFNKTPMQGAARLKTKGSCSNY